ncbi:MAG TPA: thioredoxin family protein [Candidatus Eremiobacteraceae bacterium]|nr:thioredoxin family protein [Candidatus Eremiobacteraceae bacterium]
MRNGFWKLATFGIIVVVTGATQMLAQAPRMLPPPTERRNLYPDGVDAKAEITEALADAKKTHRRVLLIFGGNWCYDCHVLDAAFRSKEIAPTLNQNYVVVHVNIGEYDKNLDLADKYEIPLKKGVPAAAVLKSDGTLVVSQKNQEFEKARSMTTDAVLTFLEKWKPRKS